MPADSPKKTVEVNLAEEEKKDAAEAPGRIGEVVVGDENDIDSDEEEGELVDLPPEVAKALGERVFQSEEELVEALETAGFGDLFVKATHKGAVRSTQHFHHAIRDTFC